MSSPNIFTGNTLAITHNALVMDPDAALTDPSNTAVLDTLALAPESMDPMLRHDALLRAQQETTLDGMKGSFGVDIGPDQDGYPRIRRGTEYKKIFSFTGNAVADPTAGTAAAPSFMASREGFEGNKFTDVYIEFEDNRMILFRRTEDTHGAATQADQRFEAMSTYNAKGEPGSPSNPMELDGRQLDGLVVAVGRPLRLSTDPQGNPLVTKENVRRVLAVNMDLDDTSLTGKIHPGEEDKIRKVDPKARFNEVHKAEMKRRRAVAQAVLAASSQP